MSMYYIPIIVGSTRRDRQSIKVARFVFARLQLRAGVATEMLDLLEYNFPIMEERLHRRDDPPPRLQEYAATKSPARIRSSSFRRNTTTAIRASSKMRWIICCRNMNANRSAL